MPAYEIPGFSYSETWDGVAATIPRYSAVQIGADTIALSGAAGNIDGIVQQICTILEPETVAVVKSGISFAIAGAGDVTKGDELDAAADGSLVTTAGANPIGRCLWTAVAGELTCVLLY